MKMFKLSENEKGSASSALLIALTVLVLVGFATVAGIYFSRYTVLQREFDSELAEQLEDVKAEQKRADEAEFAERQKEPFRSYSPPDIFGQIEIKFPKSWSLYTKEDEQGSAGIDMTAHPEIVKDNKSAQSPYALRMRLERKLYSEHVTTYDSKVSSGKLKASPVKVSGITGLKLVGDIDEKTKGVLVILPLRDKTVSLWTESDKYTADFEKILERSNINP
jgi:hypothetical protein